SGFERSQKRNPEPSGTSPSGTGFPLPSALPLTDSSLVRAVLLSGVADVLAGALHIPAGALGRIAATDVHGGGEQDREESQFQDGLHSVLLSVILRHPGTCFPGCHDTLVYGAILKEVLRSA